MRTHIWHSQAFFFLKKKKKETASMGLIQILVEEATRGKYKIFDRSNDSNLSFQSLLISPRGKFVVIKSDNVNLLLGF